MQVVLIKHLQPAALRAAQSVGYLSYSEADFEAFRLQGRHVAPTGGKFGTSMTNVTPSVQR